MATQLRITGTWPSPISIAKGWARARSRPWNDECDDAFIRIDRGSSEFLESCTDHLVGLTGASVFSPAIYETSSRIWRKVGYQEAHRLDIFERSLNASIREPKHNVQIEEDPPWERLRKVDLAAFQGFWRMSRAGLQEAMTATKRSAVLTVGDETIKGYAIVGTQWNVAYLQRIAVEPESSGHGLGLDLVRGAMAWARAEAARVLVLNVRKDNEKARGLYRKAGFTTTGAELQVLRYGS